jgi:predicted RNase H-like HicB family nuclease
MTAQPSAPSADYVMIVRRESCTDGTFAWAAYHPDLPGCLAQGETSGEAVSNFAEARDLYLEDLIER